MFDNCRHFEVIRLSGDSEDGFVRFSAPKASSREHGNLFHMTGREGRGQQRPTLFWKTGGNAVRPPESCRETQSEGSPAQNLELMDPLIGGVDGEDRKKRGGRGDGGLDPGALNRPRDKRRKEKTTEEVSDPPSSTDVPL